MFYIAVCDDSEVDLAQANEEIYKYFYAAQYDFKIYNFNDGTQLLNSEIEFDIVFINIVMEGKNGIDIACELNKISSPIIILMSNSFDYLQEGYKARAHRYFIKPLHQALFTKEINDIMCELVLQTSYIRCESVPGLKLYIKNIVYAEKVGRKMQFYTINGSYDSKYTFDFWRKELEDKFFSVPYKGVIVNLQFVSKVGKSEVHLSNGQIIPLSRKYKKSLNQSFKSFLVFIES